MQFREIDFKKSSADRGGCFKTNLIVPIGWTTYEDVHHDDGRQTKTTVIPTRHHDEQRR